MIWANKVLPVFMETISGRKPGSLPESPLVVQINTTLHRLESRPSSGFPVYEAGFSRKLLAQGIS